VSGTLFVVATPIGNLSDLSPRALDTLRGADAIAAEDTRHTRGLLTHFAISGKPLLALHAHASERDIERVLERLESGQTVALVTDAGTPVVSDPGDAVVRAAIERGARVVPIPGPSAVLAALAASGLAGAGGFRFVGFLPRDGKHRREAIARVCETPEPVILFESPNRTNDTLRDLAEATPDRRACVARELTKVHEEIVRGTLRELAAARGEWLGEIAIVLGAHEPGARSEKIDDEALDVQIEKELSRGARAKEIAERLSAWSGRTKRDVYARVLAKRGR
jgi:16S rRNA (cytidine1402-2'-O)-methyltransferase